MPSRTELAKLLGITTRHVDRLTDEGVLPRGDDGEFDVAEAVPAYCAHIRRDEPTREARRGLLKSQTVDRQLKTRHALAGLATREELTGTVTDIWLTFLEAWRGVSRLAYYQLRPVVGEEKARVVASNFENEMVGWMAQARDNAEAKLAHVLHRVADKQRVDELMRQFEAAAGGAREDEGEPA
jgi:hypothetical protein